MKGLLFLLCCTEMLGALLCGAQTTVGTNAAADPTSQSNLNENDSTGPISPSSSLAILTTDVSTKSKTPPPSSAVTQESRRTHSPAPQTTPTPKVWFYKKECLLVFLVAGGLIVGCAFFLVCTLLLLWKVCQLNRRIKMLSSDSDLISSSNYWVGTAKKDKNKAEAEAKETTVLMSDICQAQKETDNGTAKEEGEKVKEDGQTGEEEKKKEEGEDASKSEDAAATPAEDAASPKPQEEASEPVAAPSSQVAEEPKDVV